MPFHAYLECVCALNCMTLNNFWYANANAYRINKFKNSSLANVTMSFLSIAIEML